MSAEQMVLATVVAGAVGVPLVNGIKKLMAAAGYTLEAKAALLATVSVSILLSLVVLAMSGAFEKQVSIETVGGVVGGVFAVATVIYKVLASTPEPKP